MAATSYIQGSVPDDLCRHLSSNQIASESPNYMTIGIKIPVLLEHFGKIWKLLEILIVGRSTTERNHGLKKNSKTMSKQIRFTNIGGLLVSKRPN